MFTTRYLELQETLTHCEYTHPEGILEESDALQIVHKYLKDVHKDKGIVYVVGNGGSASIASHFSIDLLNALHIRSMTLFDCSKLTCFSNDYGYENVFSKPLTHLLSKEDLLVAISSSGASENILRSASVAQGKKCRVITLSGFSSNNPLRQLGDLNFWLDSSDYGLVETGHFFLLHTIIDTWKSKIFTYQDFSIAAQDYKFRKS